jgi:formylglycine-generating enzyme required for sulfatase activity
MKPIDAVTPPPAVPTVDADNPWPGLLSFTEADSEFFRGRGAEIDALHRLVARDRLTVLFGLSGLGKSSLLLAGLFPQLRLEGALPVYVRLVLQDNAESLRLQTLAAIVKEAARCGGEAPAVGVNGTLWEYFHTRDADFWDERNRLLTPVLVFDQFEEVFTLGRRNRREAQSVEDFLNELSDLIEGRPPAKVQALLESTPGDVGRYSFARHNYKVILSLREDFLPELESLKTRIPSLAINRYRIQRMKGKAAFEVVAQAPHLIDAPVAEQVVRFVAAARDEAADLSGLEVEPALLSVVCRELNLRRNGEKITRDLLKGTQGEILSDFYERSTGDLDPGVRVFIEDQLLTATGYRDSIAEERALDSGVSSAAIEALLQRRLIRREEHSGVARLELTHDLLTSVVAASRDKRHRDETRAMERKAWLEAEERTREARRKPMRSRTVAGVLALLTLLAMGAAGWALYLRHQAVAAKDQALAAQGRANTAEGQAVHALGEVVKRLDIQVASADPAQVGPAIEQLVSVYNRDPADVLALIPDERFDSYPFFYGLVTSLDDAAANAQLGDWARRTRALVGYRMSKARKIAAPPSVEADSKLNPRILVKAARFRMGSVEGQGLADEHPLHWVQLSSFYMQQHEVTSEEYSRFDPKYRRGTPLNITWYDALMYAVWVGGYLPTEAQWEYSARGTDGRKYSWGNEEPTMTGDMWRRWRHPDRASPTGIRDLSGNNWEWCADVYGPYSKAEQKDPTGPKEGYIRVLRGGSSLDQPDFMRAGYRYNYHPAVSANNVRFRVVWKVSEDRR